MHNTSTFAIIWLCIVLSIALALIALWQLKWLRNILTGRINSISHTNEEIKEGIVMIDSDYMIVEAGDTAAEFFGISKQRLIGQSIDWVLPGSIIALKNSLAKGFNMASVEENFILGFFDSIAKTTKARAVPVTIGFCACRLPTRRLTLLKISKAKAAGQPSVASQPEQFTRFPTAANPS